MNKKTVLVILFCMVFGSACDADGSVMFEGAVKARNGECATCSEFLTDPNGTTPCFYSNDLVVELSQCLCKTDCSAECTESAMCSIDSEYSEACVECMFAESKCGPAFDACMQD